MKWRIYLQTMRQTSKIYKNSYNSVPKNKLSDLKNGIFPKKTYRHPTGT